jgi:hypothetical protein
LEEWLRRTSEGIRLSPVVPITSAGRIPQGAPPLAGLAFLTSALVLLVVAAAVFVATMIWRFSEKNTSGDRAAVQLRAPDASGALRL